VSAVRFPASFALSTNSLARLPKITGNASLLYELALTARTFGADEALKLGLVSKVQYQKYRFHFHVFNLLYDGRWCQEVVTALSVRRWSLHNS